MPIIQVRVRVPHRLQDNLSALASHGSQLQHSPATALLAGYCVVLLNMLDGVLYWDELKGWKVKWTKPQNLVLATVGGGGGGGGTNSKLRFK